MIRNTKLMRLADLFEIEFLLLTFVLLINHQVGKCIFQRVEKFCKYYISINSQQVKSGAIPASSSPILKSFSSCCLFLLLPMLRAMWQRNNLYTTQILLIFSKKEKPMYFLEVYSISMYQLMLVCNVCSIVIIWIYLCTTESTKAIA